MSEAAIKDNNQIFRRNLKAISAAFAVGILLMAAKFYAYWLTGSSAILSDALESIINVAAGGFALGSVLLSSKPPDESHPYGHGKIEFFSAGFEGALIILAALGIFFEGVGQILDPKLLPKLESGMAILFASAAVNLIMGVFLIKVGRRTGSIALKADGKHLLTDVYTSVIVLLGVAAVHFTGRLWLDGFVACVAGTNIVVSGFKLVRQAFGGLMDASDPSLLERICDILIRYRRELWIDVHRLRAWKSGAIVHVDFHLILPRNITLEDGHKEVKDLEQIFNQNLSGMADVLIHLDPCADPECPVCKKDPCEFRQSEQRRNKDWRRKTLIKDAAELTACEPFSKSSSSAIPKPTDKLPNDQ